MPSFGAALTFLVLLIGVPEASRGARPGYPEQSLHKGKTLTGYAYLSGGLGFDEQRAMARLASAYNLKLFFARQTGTPISQARLLIGANNSGLVDNILARGPVFYLRLPPGTYTLVARFKTAVVLMRDVRIAEGQRRTMVLRGD